MQLRQQEQHLQHDMILDDFDQLLEEEGCCCTSTTSASSAAVSLIPLLHLVIMIQEDDGKEGEREGGKQKWEET